VISTLEDSLANAPVKEIWNIENNLSYFYLQINDVQSALYHAQKALSTAPETEQERIQSLIDQLTDSLSP
jgi:hypothetical protein